MDQCKRNTRPIGGKLNSRDFRQQQKIYRAEDWRAFGWEVVLFCFYDFENRVWEVINLATVRKSKRLYS